MRGGVLFGSSEDDGNKKVERITTSFPSELYEIIEHIAEVKNISQSEVVFRLCKAKLEEIEQQTEIIEKNPQVVAFDLLTRD